METVIPFRKGLCKFFTLKSKLISRAAKPQVYKTVIRPVVTYVAETWTLTLVEENALTMFKRRII
jgi:hypothetical protein